MSYRNRTDLPGTEQPPIELLLPDRAPEEAPYVRVKEVDGHVVISSVNLDPLTPLSATVGTTPIPVDAKFLIGKRVLKIDYVEVGLILFHEVVELIENPDGDGVVLTLKDENWSPPGRILGAAAPPRGASWPAWAGDPDEVSLKMDAISKWLETGPTAEERVVQELLDAQLNRDELLADLKVAFPQQHWTKDKLKAFIREKQLTKPKAADQKKLLYPGVARQGRLGVFVPYGLLSPLGNAIIHKRTNAIKKLLPYWHNLFGWRSPSCFEKKSPLYLAPDVQTAKMILDYCAEHGFNIDVDLGRTQDHKCNDAEPGYLIETPLHAAWKRGDREMVKLLLNYGADYRTPTWIYEDGKFEKAEMDDEWVSDMLYSM